MRFRAWLVALTASLFVLAPARAAVVLDAHYSGTPAYQGSPEYGALFNNTHPVGQTFTAINSGQLTAIDVYLFDYSFGSPADLTFTLQSTVNGGVAGGSVLAATATNSSGLADGYYHFALGSANAHVDAGGLYAFVLSTSSGNPNVSVGIDSPGTYDGGSMLFSADGGSSLTASANDVLFSAYVDASAGASPVPEPASILVLIAGAGLAGVLQAGRARRGRSG